jgi:hypothetical protein
MALFDFPNPFRQLAQTLERLEELAGSLDRVHRKLHQNREIIMANQAEVLAAIEELKATAAEEKTEVVAAVANAVAAAVAPLEQVILELQGQIANGADLSDLLAAVQGVTADVEAIVEASAPEEPEPVEPLAEPEV